MAGKRQLSGLRISQVLRIRYVFELKRQWLRCIEERRQGRLERRWIETARSQPAGLIIGLPVALAGIADQRHQRPRLIRLSHVRGEPTERQEIGARRAPDRT